MLHRSCCISWDVLNRLGMWIRILRAIWPPLPPPVGQLALVDEQDSALQLLSLSFPPIFPLNPSLHFLPALPCPAEISVCLHSFLPFYFFFYYFFLFPRGLLSLHAGFIIWFFDLSLLSPLAVTGRCGLRTGVSQSPHKPWWVWSSLQFPTLLSHSGHSGSAQRKCAMLQAELKMVFDFPLYCTETLLWADHLHSPHRGENHWSRPVSPAGGTWESNSLCHFSSLGLNIWLEGEATLDGLTVVLPFKFGMLFWSQISLSEILILITWKASRRVGIMHWALHFQSALQIPANEFSATSSVGEDVLLARWFYKGGKTRLRGEKPRFQDFKQPTGRRLLWPRGCWRHLVCKNAQHQLLF